MEVEIIMKKRKGNLRKRMLAVLLVAVLAAGMLSNAAPITVLAAEPVPQADDIATGTDWTLDADGKLTISSDTGMLYWRSQKSTYNEKLKSAVLQNGVTSIIDNAFSYCSSLEKITIPGSVASIGQSAFEGCSSLTEITIPGSVASIGQKAFAVCSSLEEITIPAGVTSIGLGAFANCTSLTKVTLQEGVTSIGTAMFSWCSSLEGITIPASVASIRDEAFIGCTRLETVTMLGEPPTLGGNHVFGLPSAEDKYQCRFVLNNARGIRVPEGKEQEYKAAWTAWADYITDKHKHGDVTLDAWTEADSLPSSGAYYLTRDVEVSGQTTISGTLTLCLNGCKIDAKQSGRIFMIQNSGSLTLYDCGSEKKGTLTGGSFSGMTGGGAIYVESGRFIMNGGTISGNTAKSGGGVEVTTSGSFTMNGGEISGNTANSSGGGINVSTSSFTMNGGIISGNTANNGGGINVSTSSFTMNGGKISGNTAVNGGGVRIYNNAEFTMNGGAISGNTADRGGIYASLSSAQQGSVTLNGTVDITENAKADGTASNIYLAKNIRDSNISKLIIGSSFSTNTPIGVSIATPPTSCVNPVTVATGAVTDEVYEMFTSEMSDDSGCSLGYTNTVIQFEIPHEYDNDSDMTCNVCGYDRTPQDTQAPTGEIKIEDNLWTNFLNSVSFELFFKETKQATITAQDADSGVDKIYWHLSESGMTEAQVKALEADAWSEGNSLSIAPDKKCIIYAKITDKAGNAAYLSSDGLVFDGTAPVITGVTDGGTYNTPQAVTVTDALSGVKNVTVNGTEVTLTDGKFTLGTAQNPQTVVATDKAGNTTAVTVTVRTQSQTHTHSYGDWQSDSTQHWKACSCGDVTDRANHNFGDWITDREATAAEAGTKHRECQTCHYSQTETIPATGTEPGSGTVTPEVKPGDNAPATNISTPTEELKDMLLTEDEKQQVQNGTNIRIVLEVQDVGNAVSSSDKESIKQALNDFTVGQYLNIDLYKLVGSARTDITETAKKIRIVISVPDSLKNAGSGTRTFAIIRVHDGRAELLTDMDDSADTITIETDRFSTYGIVYKDSGAAPTETSSPQPTETPSSQPTETPSSQPTVTPPAQPTVTPQPQPTVMPSAQPTNTAKPDETEQTGNQLEKRKDLSLLLASGKQSGKNGIKLSWTKCKNISGYEVYWSYCDGRNNYKKAKTIKAAGKRTWLHRNLKTNRTYKYFITAYKMVDGKKHYITKSPTIHVAMKYDKRTNIQKIKVNKAKITLKKGKTFRIQTKLQLENRKKKALSHVAKLRYYTSNLKTAVVSAKGKITAKHKGTCLVYVIANNGMSKKIKVTVK